MAAVEFALVLPVMVVIYFGIVELTQAVMLDRLVALASSTVTNIVTQYTTISASQDIPDILDASVKVLAPYPAANASLVVTCITIDANGNATVKWSQSLNAPAMATGQAVAIPAKLDIPNTSVVLGQASYPYTPGIDFLHLGTFNLQSAVYMAPRDATTINLVP